MDLIAAASVAVGLCLLGYGLWHLATGRSGRLTPGAIARSGAAVIRWYGASFLPWAGYFLAGPRLLTSGSRSYAIVALSAAVVAWLMLLAAWRAQRR